MQVYGPVPSRRLGLSLGVDITPCKTCTLDCVYCQLGRTTDLTVQRTGYFNAEEIAEEIEQLAKVRKPDYVTFSGSGEPTLNTNLGKMIELVKKRTGMAVAVITNSTLVSESDVRKEIELADVLLPSLDAATDEVFQQINRPHSILKIEQIIEGLARLREEYTGKIWLEVMVVKGINDTNKEIKQIRKAIDRIQPDRIDINTPVRPPSEDIKPPSSSRLRHIQEIFGENSQLIGNFVPRVETGGISNAESLILEMVRRRPVTLKDISGSLGMNLGEAAKYVGILIQEGKVNETFHGSERYFVACEKE